MSDNWTPTAEQVRTLTVPQEAFDRWLTNHDDFLREQIARDIRAEAIRLSGLVPDSQLDVLAFISDQYLRIIRGES